VPQWLEDLLIFGVVKSERIGLFAKFSNDMDAGYAGDPVALLTWYTKLGLYEDACRVVIAVLRGPNPPARRQSAPSRWADQGKTDYLPQNKIDLLFNLMSAHIKKGDSDEERLDSIRSSREALEEALVQYFELIKISDDGQRSAMLVLA
jgi:hypothetical protein